MKYHRKHRGFSLVELLVVIAIIALLLSILLPSLGSSRRVAKMMVCATNFRSLKVANEFYADESKEWYVPINGSALGMRIWQYNKLYNHLLERTVPRGQPGWELGPLRCPEVPLKLPAISGQRGGAVNVFAWNWTTVSGGYNPSLVRRNKVVGRQSEIIQGSDCTDWHMNRGYSRYSVWQTYGEMRLWNVAYRHINSLTNVVYFDGHIESQSPDEIAIDRVPQEQHLRLWNVYQ